MNKPLEEMTPDELRDYADELELKNRLKTIPKPLSEIKLDKFIELCELSFRDMVNEGFQEDEFMTYISEAALEAVYGKTIFNWINDQLK